jgi:hypothetical protein
MEIETAMLKPFYMDNQHVIFKILNEMVAQIARH